MTDFTSSSPTGQRFERAVSIMARLRAPGGCPWDREQTFDSIKPYTLEETYEVLEAIDNRDWKELTGELGDLLLQVLFYSQMANEQGMFSIDEVLDRLSSKLVDRHPHVFGEVKAETSADVLRNWEALKAEEKKKRLEAGGGKGEGTQELSRRALETEKLRDLELNKYHNFEFASAAFQIWLCSLVARRKTSASAGPNITAKACLLVYSTQVFETPTNLPF